MVSVLQSYLDNPQMLLGLSQDSRTPPAILQQIALNTTYREAQVHAIRMMVNNSDYEYSQEIFQEILMNVDISSCA
jgi:hypothetical protein